MVDKRVACDHLDDRFEEFFDGLIEEGLNELKLKCKWRSVHVKSLDYAGKHI